jgi:hypothetical protein
MSTTTTTDYNAQAEELLKKLGAELSVQFVENGKHFADDTDTRDIYKVTLKRGRRSYSFRFGQSIAHSAKVKDRLNGREFTLSGKSAGSHSYTHSRPEKFPRRKGEYNHDFLFIEGTAPTAYDILACLTKYDPGTFEDFCDNFGCDTDSRKAKKTYRAVMDEFLNVSRMFTESEREELAEIQ